jgi:hypothetical protein
MAAGRFLGLLTVHKLNILDTLAAAAILACVVAKKVASLYPPPTHPYSSNLASENKKVEEEFGQLRVNQRKK